LGLQDTDWPINEGFDPYRHRYQPSGDAPIFICSMQDMNLNMGIYDIHMWGLNWYQVSQQTSFL
jgi:hypothetical protein